MGAIREDGPREVRGRRARGLAGFAVPGQLVAQFSREEVKDVAVFLASARLGEDEWLAILPTMPPQSRSVLRSRRDLPQRVQALLESFGPADLALAAPEEPELPWPGLEGREETAARPAAPAPPPAPTCHAARATAHPSPHR